MNRLPKNLLVKKWTSLEQNKSNDAEGLERTLKSMSCS